MERVDHAHLSLDDVHGRNKINISLRDGWLSHHALIYHRRAESISQNMSEPFHHRPTLKQVGLCLVVMQASLDVLRLDKQAI